MSHSVTLNSIAIDVVGQYTEATKNLVGAYGTAGQRAVSVASHGFERLVQGRVLPLSGDVKVGIIGGEQRLVGYLTNVLARTTERVNSGLDQVCGRVIDGMQAYGRQTAWAKDLSVVEALRRLNLPAALVSQEIAGRVVDASRRVSERVGKAPQAVKVVKPVAKRAAKRTRRTARR